MQGWYSAVQHQRGIDGIAHPGGHGAADLQVAGGNRFAFLIIGHGNFVHSLAQVGQVLDDGQHGHQLGADGNAELGLHEEAVHLAADADDDIAQALGAEIHDPAHFHPGGVDIQPAHAGALLPVRHHRNCAHAASWQ